MSENSSSRSGALGRRLRWLRRRLWWLIILAIIASAVVVSIGRLLAPYADHARPWMEDYLSAALDRPVRLDRIEARWPQFSPIIELHGLAIGPPGQESLEIDRAQLEFKLYNLFRPARNSIRLAVLGLDLALLRDEAGEWSWQIEGGGRLAQGWEGTVTSGDLVLREAQFRVEVEGVMGWTWWVPQADLFRRGPRVEARVEVRPEGGDGSSLELRLNGTISGTQFESVRAFVQADRLELAELTPATDRGAADLRAQLEIWADWQRGGKGRFHSRAELHSLDPDGIAGYLSVRFDLFGQGMPGDWHLEVSAADAGPAGQPDPVDGLALAFREGFIGGRVGALDLEFLHRLLAPWLAHHPAYPRRLAGRVENLALGLEPDGSPFRLEGEVSALAVELVEPQALTLERVDGSLGLAGNDAVFELTGAPYMYWPGLVGAPVDLDGAAGRLRLGLGPGRVDVLGLEEIRIDHPELEGLFDGRILFGPPGPFLDFSVVLPRLEPADPLRWIPERGLAPRVREWLLEALDGLDSASVDLLFHGRPVDWPERLMAGSLGGVLDFEGLDLSYNPNWPPAEAVRGRVRFLGKSMSARIEDGRVAGVRLGAERIEIEDLQNPMLELDLYSVEADAAELAALVRAMPLEQAPEVLERMAFAGPAAAGARVRLPIREFPTWELDGEVELDGVDFRLADPELRAGELRGIVGFTREGFGPARLDAMMDETAVELGLEARLQPWFGMEISGHVPTRALVPADWARAMPALTDAISGLSDWRFEFARQTAEAPLEIALTSTLEGTAIDLPHPLDKPAGEAWPLELEIELDPAGYRVGIGLDGRLDARAAEDDGDWRLGLALGPGRARLPGEESFVITGALEVMDMEAWMGLVRRLDLPVPDDLVRRRGRIELEVDQLRLDAERSLGRVALRAARETDAWQVTLSGEAIEGSARLAEREDDLFLEARLERVAWPAPSEERAEPRPPSDLDPRSLPDLDIVIEALRWGALELGRFELAARSVDRGLEVERLASDGPGVRLNGQGRWIWTDLGPITLLILELEAVDVARALQDAGFDVALEGGKAQVRLDGRWPGGLADFRLTEVDGRLWVRIDDGSIPEARPGAGRLLGLVSLNTIPRRLRLDFRDVFGAGLSFDRIEGEFWLSEGRATTEGLEIEAPAANIRLSGTTDLKNRRYDQEVRVRPEVGSTLPVIGALAGGPIGVVAGMALQQLFERPLRGIAEVRYRISGSWEEPEIELVDAEGVPADDGEIPEASGEEALPPDDPPPLEEAPEDPPEPG